MGKYKIKNSEIKKVSRNVAETAKRFNTPRVMHWADKLDHSKSMTYVSTLASRIKEENEVDYDKIITYKTPLKIQHPLFRLSANYHLGNLPKLKDWDHNSLNFSFGKTIAEQHIVYDTMLNTPKTIVRAYAHKYNDNESGKEYILLHFYALAHELKESDLPCIYRIDILSSPNNPKFYGVKGVAVVGGCVDGDCPLFQIITENKDTARIYKYKSDHTIYKVNPLDDVDNAVYKVKQVPNITCIKEACDYAFDIFGVKSRIETNFTTNKISELLVKLSEPACSIPIAGGHFVSEFLAHGITSNDGFERQYIHTDDGTIKKSNIHGIYTKKC